MVPITEELKERFKMESVRKKVLIVEDEPCMREVLKIRVEMMGFEAETADDGSIALEKVKTYQPDLILLDLMLPKIDGFHVCKKLKSDPQYKHIPVIVVTARLSEEDKKKCMYHGADEYMTKPVDPQLLDANIHKLIDRE